MDLYKKKSEGRKALAEVGNFLSLHKKNETTLISSTADATDVCVCVHKHDVADLPTAEESRLIGKEIEEGK